MANKTKLLRGVFPRSHPRKGSGCTTITTKSR